MHKSGLILASALTILAVILAVSQTEKPTEIKIYSEEQLAQWQDENAVCTWDQAVECATFIKDTVLVCAKAFDTKGKDIVADIKCVKSLLVNKKACWPCICAEAERKGWNVIGC